MKRQPAMLPLGVDIGTARVRVALVEHAPGAAPKLIAVAARDHGGDPAAALRTCVAELPCSERRCVLGMRLPEAGLNALALPSMPPWERRRVARFEAGRFAGYPASERVVVLERTRVPERWAIGTVRKSALAATIAVAKQAGLHIVAVDDASLALRRTFPRADAAVDIGDETTRVIFFGADVPAVALLPTGGKHFTAAIAQSLGVDGAAAETRKRTIGFGGAGDAERDAFVADVGAALAAAHDAGQDTIRDVILCGNGSRIPVLDHAIAAATGYRAALGSLPAESSDTIPADVLRAAAPDWSLAVGLSLWSTAA